MEGDPGQAAGNQIERDEQLKAAALTGNPDAVNRYLGSFPPGYRFVPRDDELIDEYLLKKVADERLPINKIMDENIYEYHPQELTEKYDPYECVGGKRWYFFTSRRRKYKNGSRPSRSAGDGYWKATGSESPVLRKNTVLKIGVKRNLDYQLGNVRLGTKKKTNWSMAEYKAIQKALISEIKDEVLDPCVLCMIYEKPEKEENTEKPKKERKKGAKRKESAKAGKQEKNRRPKRTQKKREVVLGDNKKVVVEVEAGADVGVERVQTRDNVTDLLNVKEQIGKEQLNSNVEDLSWMPNLPLIVPDPTLDHPSNGSTVEQMGNFGMQQYYSCGTNYEMMEMIPFDDYSNWDFPENPCPLSVAAPEDNYFNEVNPEDWITGTLESNPGEHILRPGNVEAKHEEGYNVNPIVSSNIQGNFLSGDGQSMQRPGQ